MASNETLAKAKTAKFDEFYTQLADIERELVHYRHHFKDKVVLCNCDDPYESNFFKYFAMNFNFLGLKKLVCTCYHTSQVINTEFDSRDLFNFQEYDLAVTNKNKRPYKIEINEVLDFNNDGAIDLSDVEYLLKNDNNTLTILNGDGDFRSEECVEFLKNADIVVTNPPFSLFREYINLIMQYEKNFLIIANPNSLHYKEVFPLIKENKVWIGYKSMSSDMLFNVSDEYASWLVQNKKQGSGYRIINGEVKGRAQAIWLTNLDVKKRHEDLIMYETYSPEKYPKFDNFNAININKVSEIPVDYYDVMGVPDSFMDSYNPDQFEILGRSGDTEWVFEECSFFTPPMQDKIDYYKKINKTWRLQNVYLIDKNGMPDIVYSRLFIRRKR